MYNILRYLDCNVRKHPEKTAVTDEDKSLTFKQLDNRSDRIGTVLSRCDCFKMPVGVYMEKSCDTVAVLIGIVKAGGCYSVLNPELTDSRLKSIAAVLNPRVIITAGELKEQAEQIFEGFKILTADELIQPSPDSSVLKSIREKAVDTDPLYINFTSGSTGTPKGIVVSGRSVIDFINVFTETFDITENDVIANQAPFDFDVSVKDIYSALKSGAELVIVPRHLFSKPALLINFLCEHKITTMIWAVSALCLISTFHALDYKTPETVNKILFSGEVMPQKALKNFKAHLPEAMYVNLYGPTEITCNCTYHILEKDRDYSDGIPIGKSFPNEDVFLLDEDGKLVAEKDKTGEITVRGTALSLGYYNSPEQNKEHFVQNPLNPYYPEIVYKTGDLARYNERGELVFCGRKDFQIKYMGHRIELEEIEREMSSIEGVERCCCIFDEKKSRLKGFYIGNIGKDELHSLMKKNLPSFMVPGILRQLEEMPLTKNGKTDRKKLLEISERKV